MSEQVEINLSTAWCSFHALPWKASWPAAGALIAMMELFSALVERPEILAEAGYNEEAGTSADTAELTKIIGRHSPVCCYIARRDPDALRAAYEKAGVDPPTLQG